MFSDHFAPADRRSLCGLVAKVLCGAVIGCALVTLTGCEERVIGARGPGAGFYKVSEPLSGDDRESAYGQGGAPKR